MLEKYLSSLLTYISLILHRAGIDHKENEEETITLKDAVRRLPVVAKTEGKVKAVHLVLGRGAELRVSILCTEYVNNTSFLSMTLRTFISQTLNSLIVMVSVSSLLKNLAVVVAALY